MQATMYRICIRGCVTERIGPASEGMRLETGAGEPVCTGEIATSHNFMDASTGSVT